MGVSGQSGGVSRDDLVKALATLSSLGFCVAKATTTPGVPRCMRRPPKTSIVTFKDVLKEYDRTCPKSA